MPRLNEEQMNRIRGIDLLTYLKECEPQELVHVSGNEYSTRTHDSLKISNGKWIWWSRGIGGVSALDYLIKVRGKPFKKAVKILSDMKATEPPFLLPQASGRGIRSFRKLLLPEESKSNDEAIGYLESRGIDREVIDYCIGKHLLYQSEPYHNCIFIGFDEDDEARYAFYRGTTRERVMGEASGSDKRYSFRLGDNAETIHVFEGILDLLSYATISKMYGEDWKSETLLSLGGVCAPSHGNDQKKIPVALKYFLDTHPETETVCLHLDNDFAGRKASVFISDQLKNSYRIRDEPPPRGKDYNEFLVQYLANQHEKTRAKVPEDVR